MEWLRFTVAGKTKAAIALAERIAHAAARADHRGIRGVLDDIVAFRTRRGSHRPSGPRRRESLVANLAKDRAASPRPQGRATLATRKTLVPGPIPCHPHGRYVLPRLVRGPYPRQSSCRIRSDLAYSVSRDRRPVLTRRSSLRGVAQPGLARLTGGQKVAGSNPVTPIEKSLA
jgi:hypothetical protein